ncbi:MAG: DDE-type integrase/transposase/recombinase [Phycisphaerales bacterium]
MPRSTVYYEPRGPTESDLCVMRRLDEQSTATPFYAVERMTCVCDVKGLTSVTIGCVGYCVRWGWGRSIRSLGGTCANAVEHRVYPHLLRRFRIDRPNYVWSADVAYLRLSQGFVYLVAMLDWFSRYVLSWSLSATLDAWSCVEALREALRVATPEIRYSTWTRAASF